ncbi:DUF3149 domain-containing protein [Chitinimonas lacunae]|uniref:DUF3149 domain-containing protein n=1 Tax=Chitinimonas lacunae TaxID=1963018 RepID=A0ABV8MWL3_9NEIS
MNVALQDLFTTDIGILSLATIGFIVGMAGYLGWFVHQKVREAEQAEKSQPRQE